MQRKIFRTSLLIALGVLVALFLALTAGMYGAEYGQLTASLREEARLAASALGDAADAPQVLRALRTSRRITLMSPEGAVLYDSAADARHMESHADRAELAEALTTGESTTARLSGTLGRQMVYHALLLPSGDVLRLAAAQQSVWGRLMASLPWMLAALALCLALAAVASRVATRRLVAPITAIDLDDPLDNDCYEELSPLLKRLYEQQQANAVQLELMREQREKTDALLSHMREGLVVLGQNERILSMNGAARDILGLRGRDATGHTLIEINRSAELRAIADLARAQGVASGAWQSGARHYRVVMSRVGQDEGWLILMQDDTAEHEAEAMRRAFTANVSHELRTPLTAISGYAELMENGMMNERDGQLFASRIHHEASRMLALVEDILRLSQLDEGSVRLELRRLELRELAEEAARSLEAKAAAQGVALTVTGEASLTTDATLASEIIYNLVDNAIKYNRPQGSVAVEVGERDGRAFARVTDTGVGIPRDQQAKVFERFYRVDKSRSKATGGTGLGLSIVKHAAQLLNADVRLESEPGDGTSITVLF